MAKLEYVCISEDANRKNRTDVVIDFGQPRAKQKLTWNYKEGKSNILQWDIETPTAQGLKKAGVIEVLSKAEAERRKSPEPETKAEETKPENKAKGKAGKTEGEEGKTE
jgi:hypothetical protein